MLEKRNKKIISFSVLVVLILFLVVFVYFVNPEDLVEKIGVRNGYILAFLVSFFGGFSAGGSFSFITLLITLSVGGLNPIYLGLISGISLATGDMIMFYAGSKGRELIKGKWDEKINKIANYFEKRKWKKRAIPLIAYIYVGFAPLPNDIFVLFMAAIKYPIKKMAVILILGDITFALVITLLFTKQEIFPSLQNIFLML